MERNKAEKLIIGTLSIAVSKAKVTGKLPLKTLSFYNVVNNLLLDFDEILTTEDKRLIDSFLLCIQSKSRNICTFKYYSTSGTTLPIEGGEGETEVETPSEENIAPTISDTSIDYLAEYYPFVSEDFTSTFADVDGDSPETLRISTLPASGDLEYNGSTVLANQEIDLSTISGLTYTRTDDVVSVDNFNFQVSDNNVNKLYSNMATMTMNINLVVPQPPTETGENTIPNLESQTEYIFTLADFTDDTTPTYSHPQGEILENIKITVLPGTGSIEVNGETVNQFQNISADELSAGVVIYIANTTDMAGYTESFSFSVSDVASHEFTEGGLMNMTVNAYVNEPPVIGDGELSEDEGVITVFTRDDFTTNTVPPYSDKEGDLANKLRISVLPVTGVIKLSAIAIVAGDIINFADIDLSLLTYTQSASAGGTSASFEFQIADTESDVFSD